MAPDTPHSHDHGFQAPALLGAGLIALLGLAVFFLGFLVAPLAILTIFYVGFAASDRSLRFSGAAPVRTPADGTRIG